MIIGWKIYKISKNFLPLSFWWEGWGEVFLSGRAWPTNMFGYATDLRSNTQGRGTFSMEFQKYEQVPANIEKEIIEKSGAAK